MGGVILDQALPSKQADQIDPFLLLHHWKTKYDKGKKQQEVGVGPHPHRGFSPVTFIFKGGVHHRDSTGVSEVVTAGGTQWMNSGSGIVHSERPSLEVLENGGEFELIQFWINAPAKHKMDKPVYQPLDEHKTPVIKSADGLSETYVIAGEMNGIKGEIRAHSDVLILRVNMKKEAKLNLSVPVDFNAFIYQLDGESTINNHEKIGDKSLVWFLNDDEKISIQAASDVRLILLSGKPINEPVATYGPFVMNTQDEIAQAIEDFQSGKMGNLVEQF